VVWDASGGSQLHRQGSVCLEQQRRGLVALCYARADRSVEEHSTGKESR
jgi:hypothetical protein